MFVESGIYEEQFPIRLPQNVSIKGDEFRRTVIRPKKGISTSKWVDTWFKGTGRTIENEIYFNNAQQPLMESNAGYMAITEEGIEANLSALGKIGIKGNRNMFDTSLIEEIQ